MSSPPKLTRNYHLPKTFLFFYLDAPNNTYNCCGYNTWVYLLGLAFGPTLFLKILSVLVA